MPDAQKMTNFVQRQGGGTRSVAAAAVLVALAMGTTAAEADAAPLLTGGAGTATVALQTDGRWVSWGTERSVVARDTRTRRQYVSSVPAGCSFVNAAAPGLLFSCSDPVTGLRTLRIADRDGQNLRTVPTPPAGVVASALGRIWIASIIVMDRGRGLFINPLTGEQRRASTGADPNSTDLRKPRYATRSSKEADPLRVTVDGRTRSASACRPSCRVVSLDGPRLSWVEDGALRILELTDGRRWEIRLPRGLSVTSIVTTSHEVWANGRSRSGVPPTRYHARLR